MKRWTFVALGTLLASAVLPATAAHAEYRVIKWTSGYCQIWDYGYPTRPFPADYVVMTHKQPTFDRALAVKGWLVGHRYCAY